MNNDKLIAKFMGYEVVRIGYWALNGNGDTTAWQRKNKDWLEKPEIIEQYNNSIGNYYAKVSENVIISQQDIDYTNWNDLMPVVDKIEALGFGFTVDPWGMVIIEYISGNEKEIISFINDNNYPKLFQYYHTVTQFIEWYNDQNK